MDAPLYIGYDQGAGDFPVCPYVGLTSAISTLLSWKESWFYDVDVMRQSLCKWRFGTTTDGITCDKPSVAWIVNDGDSRMKAARQIFADRIDKTYYHKTYQRRGMVNKIIPDLIGYGLNDLGQRVSWDWANQVRLELEGMPPERRYRVWVPTNVCAEHYGRMVRTDLTLQELAYQCLGKLIQIEQRLGV